MLVERLGQDAGSRSAFVVLPNASVAAATTVATALRALPGVQRVLPEDHDGGNARIPAALWHHRLLLRDPPADEEAWRNVLGRRLADAALADDDWLSLISADPLLASVHALAAFAAPEASFQHDSERYLVVLTSAPPFDVNAQTNLAAAMRATLTGQGFADAALYGSGIYAADLQATVRREATLFSVLASAALFALLLWRFRSFATVLAIGAPMLTGAAAGLSALAFLYSEVHGIALAFGFTLLGVTLDYPLHLVTSRARGRDAPVWPTLRLGIASTLLAYAVFVVGTGAGLEQLGVFALVGVAAAALATAWIGNAWAASPGPPRGCAPSRRLMHWPWLVTLAFATVMLTVRSPFSDDLGALTPVPPTTLAADAELRSRLGLGDMRHVIAVRGTELETTLERTETASLRLAAAEQAGDVAGHSSVVQLLPSETRQQERHNAWRAFVAKGGAHAPDSDFRRAAAALGFAANAFDPFHEAAVKTSARFAPVRHEDLVAEPALGPLVEAHLYRNDNGWTSLIALRGIADRSAVAKRLAGAAGVGWVDLKQASASLVKRFRHRLLGVLAAALALMGFLLWWRTQDGRRALWLLGTTVAAAAASAAIGAWLRGPISPFDLMALALVLGLGLDYALFHSKTLRDGDDQVATRRAVDICALSSFLVFGILAFSSIPVLGGLGATVAAGVGVAYLLARFGRYSNSGT